MRDWDPLLSILASGPRENGSPELDQAAASLAGWLTEAGLAVEWIPFDAPALELRLIGLVVLAGGLGYWRLGRSRRYAAAAVLALAVAALVFAEIDRGVPGLGWIGSGPSHHLRVRIPAEEAQRRVVLTAHYDAKTDLLDPVQRAPVERLALPVLATLLLGALAGWGAGRCQPETQRRFLYSRLAGFAGWVAVAYGALVFAALSAGALLPDRSHGALDAGGACAVLAATAADLNASPALAHTEVEIVFLAAAEVAGRGPLQYVRERFPDPIDLPTRILDLESIGASPELAVLPGAEPGWLADLDAAHRGLRREPLARVELGETATARAFRDAGAVAATLVGLPVDSPFHRGIHSADDRRERLDPAALESTREFLSTLLLQLDSREPG